MLSSDRETILGFNPRAPCGARRNVMRTLRMQRKFQSTRPVWGATGDVHAYGTSGDVSIHAPRVGRDRGARLRQCPFMFQSTRPVWGATVSMLMLLFYCRVSIHAPRVGRDGKTVGTVNEMISFNPRAPCGARRSV